MSKLMFHLIIGSSICFLSLNCMNKTGQNTSGLNNPPPLSIATPTVIIQDNDIVLEGCQEAVTLSKGQNLTIKLPATKGTGFVWQLKEPAMLLKFYDTDVIQYEDKPAEGAVGTASKQIVRFRAEKLGTEI